MFRDQTAAQNRYVKEENTSFENESQVQTAGKNGTGSELPPGGN
jgi:hypothetical protein